MAVCRRLDLVSKNVLFHYLTAGALRPGRLPRSLPFTRLGGPPNGPDIATRGKGVYSLTYPNGDGFPLLIYFLCNAYRHLMTFAKWHLRVLEMNLSNVLWANKETALGALLPLLCGVLRKLSVRSGRRAGGTYV